MPRSDADVRPLWESLGLPGLLDLHVHFLPHNVMAKVWAYFDAVGPLTGVTWPIHYREDEDVRLARLREMGVLAFPSLVYPHKPGMAAWLNEWAGEFASAHDDVLRTATFFPEESAASYVEQALSSGARVFKAHVQVGAYDPRDPLLSPVWGLLAEAGVPVVLHCGNGPVPGAFTGPDVFADVLAEHPTLTAVIAHLGMPDYAPFLDLADRYARVHLDTTMAFTAWAEQVVPFPRELRPRLLDLADRVVLGSDFPNIPYGYYEQLAGLVRLDLGDDWLRGVLHDNGARLVGLG